MSWLTPAGVGVGLLLLAACLRELRRVRQAVERPDDLWRWRGLR